MGLDHAATRWLAAAIAVGAFSTVSHAQEAARRVELALEDCLGADAAAVRRIVAAELGAEVRIHGDPEDEPAGDAMVARADCGVESAIVVVQHARGVRFERRVELDGAPLDARARVLALSIVELVASAWSAVDALPPLEAPPSFEEERDDSPGPAPPPRVRVDPTPSATPAIGPTRPFGVRVMGVARVSGSPAHVSLGGGLGIEVGLPLSLGLGADLRYEQGDASVGPLGHVTQRVAWGSLLALVRPIVGWSSLSIGLGAKLGVAWLDGTPAEPGVTGRTHSGFVAGPTLAGHAALHLAGSGYLHLGLELSWITIGIAGLDAATGDTLASFGGPQLALTVGFEIQPSR